MIDEIKEYLKKENIINLNNEINVDFLGEKPTEFSIEPVRIEPILEKYIYGELRQFQFRLVSRNNYSQEVFQNISNSNFYYELYEKIEQKNKNKILPKIKGIQSIKCLDNGAIEDITTNTARYSILMRITYIHT